MILEGIVTTLNDDGTANISPMGPLIGSDMSNFVLRPYRTSRTYANLKRCREGVLHVIDNVELLARAAIGKLEEVPEMLECTAVDGVILADACRWYAFQVSSLYDDTDRTTIECQVVDQGRLRDCFGFNRAKHAVVEAAILATRIAFLPAHEIRAEFDRLAVIVDKTAGDQEPRAFQLLTQYVTDSLGPPQRAELPGS